MYEYPFLLRVDAIEEILAVPTSLPVRKLNYQTRYLLIIFVLILTSVKSI